MENKDQIVKDWLTRYTGVPLADFGSYILLTNFQRYVQLFADATGAAVKVPISPCLQLLQVK